VRSSSSGLSGSATGCWINAASYGPCCPWHRADRRSTWWAQSPGNCGWRHPRSRPSGERASRRFMLSKTAARARPRVRIPARAIVHVEHPPARLSSNSCIQSVILSATSCASKARAAMRPRVENSADGGCLIWPKRNRQVLSRADCRPHSNHETRQRPSSITSFS